MTLSDTVNNPLIVTDDTIKPIETVETVQPADTTPSTVHTFTISHHAPAHLASLVNPKLSHALALRTIKTIIDTPSNTLTLANDVELSFNADDKTYTLALIDNSKSSCKRDLTPLDVDYDIDVDVDAVESHAMTRGKCYLRVLALTANVLRSVRPLTTQRVFTVSIASTRPHDLVIPYTSSLQSIALSVSRMISPCDTTSLIIFNALMTAYAQPTLDLDVLECDLKLPTLSRLKTAYAIPKSI